MTGPSSQSPRDRILWLSANNGGKMELNRLRASTGMRYALLNPILDELVREGRIKMFVGMDGQSISSETLLNTVYRVWINIHVYALKRITRSTGEI